MGWLLAKIALFLGQLIAAIIPAIGREVRRNKTVKQTGADDETIDALDDDIAHAAGIDRVRMDDAGDRASS